MDAVLPWPLWLIDDAADNHAVVIATLAGDPRFPFTGFTNAADALAEFRRLALRQPALLPRIVLMDYYLGGERGDEAAAELRQCQPAGHRLIIVGYSSLRSASERIVLAGGDCILAKRHDERGINPGLRRWLQGLVAAG
jgi:CheY-like chemotaxis protein